MEWNQTSRNVRFATESRDLCQQEDDTDFLRLCNVLFAVRRERPIHWEKRETTIGQKQRHQTML